MNSGHNDHQEPWGPDKSAAEIRQQRGDKQWQAHTGFVIKSKLVISTRTMVKDGESMVNRWWINGESMVNQWWINGESMMNQWWISGKSMVNQWWIVVNNGILMVNTLVNTPGWCFGTWMDYDFPFSWEFHNPNWLWYFSQGLKPPTSSDQYKEDICLVVSNMNFIFHNIWDNPSHWRTHIFQDA